MCLGVHKKKKLDRWLVGTVAEDERNWKYTWRKTGCLKYRSWNSDLA